jgi:N-acetylmuramoyl-L-alanine amidase
MKIQNHKLTGNNVGFIESPNHSGKFSAQHPDSIIIHYTAGPSMQSAVNTFKDKNKKSSAHLVVGLDGKVTQMVAFDTIAWHAGKSSYQGRSGFNKYSIGIEIVNPGYLQKVGDKYQAWYGTLYNEDKVVKATHKNESTARYWHIYSEEQIETVFNICRLLKDKYNIEMILGHDEISLGRKSDPGPAFPLNKLRDRALNNRKDENVYQEELYGETTANSLNIRSNPSAIAETVAKPLINGTKVKLLEEDHGWYLVETKIKGWVSGKYIKMDN